MIMPVSPRASSLVPAASRQELLSRIGAWTHLTGHPILVVRPDVVVAVTRPGTRTPRADGFNGVELQSEVMNEATATAFGWRSMRSQLDVSCATRSNYVRKVELFSGHDRTGTSRAPPAPVGWIRPSPEAFMADVVAGLCAGLKPPDRSAEARPPLATPMAPRGAKVVATKKQGPPAIGFEAQIVSSTSRPDADEAIASLARSPAGRRPGLVSRVDEAPVNGRLHFRAVVGGFASRQAATAFCASLAAAGGGCLVRRRSK